jgi:hypothetical protein
MRWRAVVVVGSGLGLAGCAYSTPTPLVPATLPSFGAVDVEASELTIEDPNKDLSPDSARDVRDGLCDLLASADREAGVAGGPPARLRATVRIPQHDSGSSGGGGGDAGIVLVVAFVFVTLPLGLAIFHEEREVDLTVEASGQRFVGHGTGEAWGSIYASAGRRALSRALQNALLDAAAKRRAALATRGP